MNTQKLSIGEVAELLGITAKTIRHYHDIGVLPEPPRADNGYRLYSTADVRRLQTIIRLQGYGLTLKQIAFILSSPEPDIDLRAFLHKRDADLSDQIFHLQQQQARLREALQADSLPTDLRCDPPISSQQILHQVITPISNGLADVLAQVEGQVLAELDRYPQPDAYGEFWEQVGGLIAKTVQPNEQAVILWLERYLALAGMTADDRQAQAWLNEFRSGSTIRLLMGLFQIPPSNGLTRMDERQIQRLIPLLLYEQSTPLQRTFIALLTQPIATKR